MKRDNTSERLIVAVGTENRAKLSAVTTIFAEAFKGSEIEVFPYSVESGVAAQPMSDDETIQGALNRAEAAAACQPDATFAVGLEGGVQETSYGMFLKGWAVVRRLGDAAIGIGQSGGILLPTKITEELRQGAEMGPLTQATLGDVDNEVRHTLGTNGILSGGLYRRDREFEDALRNALGRFLAARYYEE